MKKRKKNVLISLEKARESALLAVEVYNKPAVRFKSGAFVILMVIAWTALFHAYFFDNKVKPFRKKKNGRFEIRDGDYLYWELGECLLEYFKGDQDAVRTNLDFFIPLRNKIEHKSLPEIDSNIFGECQALLLNFDAYIEKFFGKKYCIRELLSFSLQLFPSSESLSRALKENRESQAVIEFIEHYRSSTASSFSDDSRFAFKAFLIQVSNHNSKDALPVQFINFDKLSEEQKSEFSRFVAMVKYKEVSVANSDLMKAGQVVDEVQKRLGNPMILRNGKDKEKFNVSIHTLFWKKYGIRPKKTDPDPVATKTDYCVYDKPHQDYLYTKKWIDFLAEKMNVEGEYESLLKSE